MGRRSGQVPAMRENLVQVPGDRLSMTSAQTGDTIVFCGLVYVKAQTLTLSLGTPEFINKIQIETLPTPRLLRRGSVDRAYPCPNIYEGRDSFYSVQSWYSRDASYLCTCIPRHARHTVGAETATKKECTSRPTQRSCTLQR